MVRDKNLWVMEHIKNIYGQNYDIKMNYNQNSSYSSYSSNSSSCPTKTF